MFTSLPSILEDCEDFGKLLQMFREDRDMSQFQLGELMSVSDKTISRYELGHIPNNLLLSDVDKLTFFVCSSEDQRIRLIDAFICHVLKQRGSSGEYSY